MLHLLLPFKDWIHSKYYINIQVEPHRKHITTPLQRPAGYYCLGRQSLFIVRIIRNTKIHSVGGMQSFGMLKRVVLLEPLDFKGLL
jgi:hypothetical protein